VETDIWFFLLCACALKRYGAQARTWRALRETVLVD
jgi:hypothetical protein